tara:strand:- start:385 stop:2397 length:2013 start_codon:yes stop_codon:yes gene_type:complete
MSRARDLADLGQDKTTLASYVDTGVTSTDLERIDITTEGTSENSKVVTADSSGHVTLAGELRGPATLVIDPATVGDESGLLHVKGGLQVDGTTTTINSETLTIDDKNIVLASGAVGGANADGAGITIDGASATMLYTHSTTSFDFNKPVNVTGDIAVDNLKFDGNTISSTDTNGPITIDTHGTGDINLTAGADVNIPANIGLTFGDDGEKIEGNGDHLTIASSGNLIINTGVYDLSNQTVDITLINTTDALNFDGNTLSIDAQNNRIGIGLNNPSSALHISAADVASSGTSNAQLHIRDTAAFSAAQNAGIAFEAEWQNGSFTQIAAINASRDSTSTGQYGGHLKFNIRTHGANVSEAMRITSAGKVGIGTSAPNTHLEVSDGVPTFRLNSTEGNVGNTDILGEISWKSADSNRTGDPIAYIRAVSENATGSATALTFGTGFDSNNASERMRIKNSGNVGIGTTAPDTKLHIQHTYDGGGDGFVHFQSDGTECGVTWERTESTARKIKWGLGADGKFNVYDETNTILCFYIATNGVIHGDFNDTSDESLKKNIQSLDSGALSKINSLRPVSFDWKEKGKGSSVGFIAQEVEKIFPSEVIGEEYVEDQVTEATYYTNSDVLPEGKKVGDIKTEAFTTAGNLGKAINTSGIVAHLTKAVQELSAKVKVLEDA